MKKSFFTVIFVLGITAFLSAQIEIKPTFGINMSKLSDEPEGFSQSARVGYQFGGSVKIGKKLYLEPGILWTRLGSKVVHADSSNLDYKTDINALRVPVFIGYQIIGGDEENLFGLRVFGGPAMSWVTKIKSNDNDLNKDDFSNIIWGADAGVGINVWLLFLDAGYEWGFTKVFKDDPLKVKNNAWWFNLGIRIKI